MARLTDALRDLSGMVGVPLALNDADMTPVASLPHSGLLDGSRMAMLLGNAVSPRVRAHLVGEGAILERQEPRRIEPVLGLELGRVHVPVRDGGGRLLGHLWAIDPDGAVDIDRWFAVRDASARALAAAGWTGDRPSAPADVVDRVLTRFVSEHPATRVVALTVTPEGVVDPTSLHTAATRMPVFRPADGPSGTSVLVHRDDLRDGVLLVGGARYLQRDEWCAVVSDLARRVRGHVGAGRVRLVASAIVTGSDDVGDHLSVVRRVVSGAPGDVVLAEDVPGYDVLLELSRVAPSAGLEVPASVRRLLATDRGRVLAATANSFLDLAGNAASTAGSLGVHRATLYYRLAQVEELTGYDLARGEHRMGLHLGLTSARLSGLF